MLRFCHSSFEGIELHCVERWVYVKNEGNVSHFNKDNTAPFEEEETVTSNQNGHNENGDFIS